MVSDIIYNKTSNTLSWTAGPNDIFFKVELSTAAQALHTIYEGQEKEMFLDTDSMLAPVEVILEKRENEADPWSAGISKIIKEVS